MADAHILRIDSLKVELKKVNKRYTNKTSKELAEELERRAK